MADGIFDRLGGAIGGPCRQGKTIAIIVMILAVTFVAAGAVVREEVKADCRSVADKVASVEVENARLSERVKTTNELLRDLIRELRNGN